LIFPRMVDVCIGVLQSLDTTGFSDLHNLHGRHCS
jgi:hypothetical protein